jgi:dolichol-phosphate mannosyltransferase
MKKVGICMPVANEESTIKLFLENVLSEISKLDYDVAVYIIMDNFSKDNTSDIVNEIAEKYPRINLVFNESSTGVVSCYLYGFNLALKDGCDFIIEMDSGGSHPPTKIKEILFSLDYEDYDAVFMSRFIKGAGTKNFPFYRRVISKGGTSLANLWLGTRYSDATSGFEAFRREVLESLNLEAFLSTGGIYQTEMKYYCHVGRLKIKELPFIYVGTTTAFKAKWIISAFEKLFRMKYNTKNVLRTFQQKNPA